MTTLTWSEKYPGNPNCSGYLVSQVVEYDLQDSKGRSIGGVASIRPYAEMIDSDEPLLWQGKPVMPKADGSPQMKQVPTGRTLYSIYVQATRNGVSFGATPRETWGIETLEAAKALSEKKVAEAKKRFEKAVAKGEGRQFSR